VIFICHWWWWWVAWPFWICSLTGGLSRDTDSGRILQLRGRIQEWNTPIWVGGQMRVDGGVRRYPAFFQWPMVIRKLVWKA